MKQKRFDEFTYIFLVNASQMAYLEEARKTHEMLQKFNELFRYLIKDDNTVMLSNEVDALRNYIDIQKTRYGDRFNIALINNCNDRNIFISHLSVIDFVDNILNSALTQYENFFNVSIKFQLERSVCLQVVMETDGEREVFTRLLMEEGK